MTALHIRLLLLEVAVATRTVVGNRWYRTERALYVLIDRCGNLFPFRCTADFGGCYGANGDPKVVRRKVIYAVMEINAKPARVGALDNQRNGLRRYQYNPKYTCHASRHIRVRTPR